MVRSTAVLQRCFLCISTTANHHWLSHRLWPTKQVTKSNFLEAFISPDFVASFMQKIDSSYFLPWRHVLSADSTDTANVVQYSSSSTSSFFDAVFVECIRSRVKHWRSALKDSFSNIEESLMKSLMRLVLGSEEYDGYIPCLSMDVCIECQVQPALEVFHQEPTRGSTFDTQRSSFGGTLWMCTSKFLNTVDKIVDQLGHSESNIDAEEACTMKNKRKKLKGKRAVVRWLKFLRWKKKKEYERMTAEEKLLYKLTLARKKEGRIVEALRKIVPKESSETTHDPEVLTPEEHFYFLKMGIKCKNYVPVGRRGIYQGVILNMHLHWKKHQTLQVVVKTFTPEEVKEIAAELARLSGGIVLDIQEDNTIIMYRGKNYSQPPTEIMSPRTTLSRKKALDKSKYRDALCAVRKYIPRLEQDLELLRARNESKAGNKATAAEETLPTSCESVNSEITSRPENSDMLRAIIGETEECSDHDPEIDSVIDSEDEALSDMFETDTDTDTENEEKVERPLYRDELERFWADTRGEPEDFAEKLRHISADAKEANSLEEKADGLPGLDEVDQMFLQAASLLKKKGQRR